jgi:plastocyanin
MHAQLAQSSARAHQPLSDLTKLTVAALAVIVLAFVYLQGVLLKRVEMPLPILQLLTVVLAGVIATGWRWTPLLAPLWMAVMIGGNWKPIAHDLAHPENTHVFGFAAFLLVVMLGCAAFGLSAVIQRARNSDAQRAPAVVRPIALALASLLVGAVIVAAIPRESGTAVSPELLAELPAMPLSAFNNGTIRVKAGDLSGLRLENPDGVGHSFDVDELNLHATMPAGKDTAAFFIADQPGTYTFYCAPHYDKVTGQGMRGTLIVEP